MATKKISELEAINAAEDNDVLVIVDTSESTTNKITKGNLLIGAGHTIEMTLNENYQIVLILKNAAGTALSTQTIDLPNENAVTNLAYNNGVLTITKQSGATSEVDISPLIEGLVTESDFNTFKEALQTILEAINEKDTEQDEAIAENYKVINKLNEKLENQQKVIDQLPQVTGQGTEVTLENTIEAPFTLFSPEGHSEQETTEGYQLLDLSNFVSTTTKGITFTKNDDDSISFNGTSTDAITLDTPINLELTQNIDYTLSKMSIYAAGQYAISLRKKDASIIGSGGLDSGSSSRTYKLEENVTAKYFRIYIPKGVTINHTIYPMVNEGSTATNYEPYTNGASPSPNWEQPIYSAGDNENLLPNNISTQTKNGIAITKNNDGTLTFNGISTEGFVLQVGTVTIGEDGEYTLSGCPSGGSLQSYFIYNMAGTPDVTDIGNGKTKALNKNDYLNMYINIRANQTFNNLVFKPKLEKGNKATSYSPYGMGSINEKIGNKNWNTSPLQDGSLTNGLPDTNYETCRTTNFIDIKPSTNYAFSINGILNRVVVSMYDKDKNFIATDGAGGYASSNGLFTTYANAYYIKYRAYNADKQLFLNGNIQLEEGSTATPYVPHEEQDYSISVQQPMRSIGDVRDCFVKKSDGWYERHKINKKIFDGTEQWTLRNNGDGSTTRSFNLNVSNLGSINLRCNKFQLAQSSTNGKEGIAIASELISMFIQIKRERLSSVDVAGFKTWLAEQYANGTPVYIDYILAEPILLPCTEEQIQQLENKPSTYKDFTIINSEDETPAYLEVSGIRDINTMFDKVTNAIVSLGGNV